MSPVCKPIIYNMKKIRSKECPPGTSIVPEPVKLTIAGSVYLLDNQDLTRNRKTHYCHNYVDRLPTGAKKLLKNIPLW